MHSDGIDIKLFYSEQHQMYKMIGITTHNF